MNSLFTDAIYLDDVPKSTWKNYFANGYRNVCYQLDSQKNGQIIFFGFDHAGNRKTFICPWQSHIKYAVKYETDEKDVYDRNVATKYFSNVFERKKYIENANGLTIVEALRPEQEFLQEFFAENVLDEDFNKHQLRIHYFDIETEISERFEAPRDARNRINMMTIYDSETEKFYTWSLDHAEIDFKEEPLKDMSKDKFVFFEFHDDEYVMLEHFLDWYEDNYPDINFGWNTRQYDIPYLTRRIENVLGKGAAQRLSPVGKYFIKEVKTENQSANAPLPIEVDISGLFVADGLVLYRDKFGIGGNLDGGFSLDNVGEHEKCGKKIQYDGSLKDLYLNDYQKFYEYNVRDVDLVKRIDDKTKMLVLARLIPGFGLINYNAIYASIGYLIGSVIAFTKTEMNRVFVSYMVEKKQFDGFEGAFVFPTVKGIYRGGIGAIDFASLYPSCIRASNISIETYVGKVLIQFRDSTGSLLPINDKDEQPFNIFDDDVAKASNVAGYYLKYPDGRRKMMNLDKLRAWIEANGIYTPNNTIFMKHEKKHGVIAKWCEHFYNMRKATKKKMLANIHRLHDEDAILSDAEKQKLQDDADNYNSRQGSFKNMINSIYGSMGTKFSPIANPDIAQSVTRLGRMCNMSASMFVLKRFRKMYGEENVPGYFAYYNDKNKDLGKFECIAVGGDTDSCKGSDTLMCRYRSE